MARGFGIPGIGGGSGHVGAGKFLYSMTAEHDGGDLLSGELSKACWDMLLATGRVIAGAL